MGKTIPKNSLKFRTEVILLKYGPKLTDIMVNPDTERCPMMPKGLNSSLLPKSTKSGRSA